MKKNGFIATSLLYSFFLVFCALLLAFVANILHNRLLLNNLIFTTKSELAEINTRRASKLEVGNYVQMSLFSSDRYIVLKDKLWIVASNKEDEDIITLVSTSAIYTTDKKTLEGLDIEAIDDIKNETTEQIKSEPSLYYNMYTTSKNNFSYVSNITKDDLNSFSNNEDINPYIKNSLLDIINKYIYFDNDNNKFYLFNENCFDSECGEIDININNPVRLIVKIDKNTPILGGSGLYSDPYTFVSYINDDNLKLHYDYNNNTGNKGMKDEINDITDLSGTHKKGQTNQNYVNNIENGIKLTEILNTKLFVNKIFSDNFTIEFRTNNNIYFLINDASFISSVLDGENLKLTINETENIINDVKNNFTVSIVKNSSGSKVYINGIETNIQFSMPTINENEILNIGSGSYFKSLRIYSKALTPDEILNNYKVDLKWGG